MHEELTRRHGSNLYPASLAVSFGRHSLKLDVPAGVWNPTPHGVHLGNVLAELSFDDQHVLELGTGCGVHAIVLAKQGAAQLTLTEITQAALDNARHNLEKHGVKIPVDFIIADWTHVPSGPYDTVVTNPPFAKSGKRYRRYFIDTLILDAHKLLRPGGRFIFVQSSMADVQRSIQLMHENGMSVRILGETSGPFRDYYFEDEQFMLEAASVPGGSTLRDDTYHEKLTVFEATVAS